MHIPLLAEGLDGADGTCMGQHWWELGTCRYQVRLLWRELITEVVLVEDTRVVAAGTGVLTGVLAAGTGVLTGVLAAGTGVLTGVLATGTGVLAIGTGVLLVVVVSLLVVVADVLVEETRVVVDTGVAAILEAYAALAVPPPYSYGVPNLLCKRQCDVFTWRAIRELSVSFLT